MMDWGSYEIVVVACSLLPPISMLLDIVPDKKATVTSIDSKSLIDAHHVLHQDTLQLRCCS